MKKVEVDVNALRTLNTIFAEMYDGSKNVIKEAYLEVAQALGNVPLENQLFMEGYKVKPKTGRNYLRAGHTAYGEAAILSVNPPIIISLDGKYIWKDLPFEIFDVYNPLDVEHMGRLCLAYKELTND